MKGHFIVAGFGLVGQHVVEQLRRARKRVVCIDPDPAVFEGYGGIHVVGEATRTEVLKKAEISTAETLVACAGTDAVNAFVILEARSLKPDITILARAEHNENVDKLYMAGADFVMALATTAARMMVQFAMAPHVSGFGERILVGGEQEISDARIPEAHPLAGKRLRDTKLQQVYGVSIMAIMREDTIINMPRGDETLRENDIVVFIGKSPAIMRFLKLLHQ